MVTYQVTNPTLFTKTVRDIDTSDLSGMEYRHRPNQYKFTGTLTIEPTKGRRTDITGEHGESDYEKQYGFRLIVNPVL